jgi:hypothetical protein
LIGLPQCGQMADLADGLSKDIAEASRVPEKFLSAEVEPT